MRYELNLLTFQIANKSSHPTHVIKDALSIRRKTGPDVASVFISPIGRNVSSNSVDSHHKLQVLDEHLSTRSRMWVMFIQFISMYLTRWCSELLL